METATIETKKGKITNVQSDGTWDSPNGLLYKWEVEFDNGEIGQTMTKDLDHKKWVVGQTVSYQLTPNVNPKYLGKLKLIEDKPFNGTGAAKYQQKDSEVITMLSCISSACTAVAQSSSFDNTKVILLMAEDFYKAAMAKKPQA